MWLYSALDLPGASLAGPVWEGREIGCIATSLGDGRTKSCRRNPKLNPMEGDNREQCRAGSTQRELLDSPFWQALPLTPEGLVLSLPRCHTGSLCVPHGLFSCQ